MNANRILLAVIAAIAIFMTPSVLTSPILAQTDTETQDTTDEEEDGNQATTGGEAADDEASYQEFKTCLNTAEGTEGSASEDEIITCFTDAGYTGLDDDNEDQDDEEENEGGNDGEENEDNSEETSN